MMVTARDQGMPSLQGRAAVYIQVLVYVQIEVMLDGFSEKNNFGRS